MTKQNGNVLIVDDTPENLRVLGELLESDGYEIRVATNGLHCLNIVRSTPIDLILLDIMMPSLDGYEVCRQLKKDESTKQIPIIFLTSLNSSESEAKGLQLGAVDYITKPFSLALVRVRVANHLELYYARRLLQEHNEHLETLVTKRSNQLVRLINHLKTQSSAMYDYLQIIYKSLWAPGEGLIEQARSVINSLDKHPKEQAVLVERYKQSEEQLLQTTNNALIMAETNHWWGQYDAQPVIISSMIQNIIAKMDNAAKAKSLVWENNAMSSNVVAGDLDLLTQAVSTIFQAAIILAQSASTLRLSSRLEGQILILEIIFTRQTTSNKAMYTLFQTTNAIHPSEAGRELGLALPLAVKIITILDGKVAIELVEPDTGRIEIQLPAYQKSTSRLLKKPVAFSTTLTIPRIACAMLRNCTGF